MFTVQPSRSRRSSKAKATFTPDEPRHVVIHDYHDHSMDAPHDIIDQSHEETSVDDHKKRSGPRGGVNVPFPTKLHVMLSKVEAEGLTDIVSWQPHGRCFVIHKPREFVDQVMPEYFRQSKLTSFQRQLNLYGFRRLTAGPDRGGYYHEMFLKHKLFLCRDMTRIRIKGTGIKGKASPETEPDFYVMPEIKPDHYVINQRIESEVLSAMEEEESHVSTFSKRATEEVDEKECFPEATTSKRAKRDSASRDLKLSVFGGHPPSIETISFQPAVLVTPEAQYIKTQVHFVRKPSGTGCLGSISRRCLYPDSENSKQVLDFAPPLYRSPSEHSLLSTIEYHSDDRISFEGQHFHYLDSFAILGSEPSKFTPTSDSVSPAGMPQSRYSSTISLPHLVSSLSDRDLSYNMHNSSVISSSSSSKEPLTELELPKETTVLNPETISSRNDVDSGWAIDIDQEFFLMES